MTSLLAALALLTPTADDASATASSDPPADAVGEPVALIGDDLSGWSGSVDDWTVEDGVLIGRTDGSLKMNRFIWADIEPVKNFVLTSDVWISAGGNSGIQYRSKLRPDLGPFRMQGSQCDVVSNNDNYNGMLYEEMGRRIVGRTGRVVVIDADGQPWVNETLEVKSFPPEQWHTYTIEARGNHLVHKIDGTVTADLVDLDAANRMLEGKLGVQTHVGAPMEIRYRNMTLTRLPDDLPMTDRAVADAAEKVVPQGGWPKKKTPTKGPKKNPKKSLNKGPNKGSKKNQEAGNAPAKATAN